MLWDPLWFCSNNVVIFFFFRNLENFSVLLWSKISPWNTLDTGIFIGNHWSLISVSSLHPTNCRSALFLALIPYSLYSDEDEKFFVIHPRDEVRPPEPLVYGLCQMYNTLHWRSTTRIPYPARGSITFYFRYIVRQSSFSSLLCIVHQSEDDLFHAKWYIIPQKYV